jgi:hypothetical protein
VINTNRRVLRSPNIRLYESGDEKEIVELLRLSFPDWTIKLSPIDYWKWKYLDCPLPSLVAVADYEGKIVGVDHYVRLNVKIGESIFGCYYGDDAATHPDYRGRGIYNGINLFKDNIMQQNGVKLGFAFTTSPTVIKENQKKGRLKFPHLLSSLLRVSDVARFFEGSSATDRLILGSGLNTFKALNRAENAFASKNMSVNKFEVFDVTHFDDSMRTFWNQVKDHFNLIIERSIEHLNWRYCDPRAGNIKVNQVVEDGEILGYIVTEIRKNDVNVDMGYVLDLLTLPGRLDVADALMQKACSYFDESNVNAIQYKFVQEKSIKTLASKYGFIDKSIISRSTFLWQYKGAEKEFDIIRNSSPEKLHFTYGDYL